MSTIREKLLANNMRQRWTLDVPAQKKMGFSSAEEDLLIKAPTIKQWSMIQQRSMSIKDGEGKLDQGLMKVLAVVELVCQPDGHKVFNDRDIEHILDAGVGSPIDRLGEYVLEKVNISVDEIEAEGNESVPTAQPV